MDKCLKNKIDNKDEYTDPDQTPHLSGPLKLHIVIEKGKDSCMKQKKRNNTTSESPHDYSVLSLAVAPPSTTKACPVMNDDCSLSARK